MGWKVVMVGGGSYNWVPNLAKDLFLFDELNGSELALVDVNAEAAARMEAFCKRLAEVIGCGWRVGVADLDAALDGADVVGVSITTGGRAATALDYDIPREFGVLHSVSDTVGPGGISRTLRNAPVFVGIARKMEERCPQAWMVHVTNPLTQLTRAVTKTTTVRCAGLCHNFSGTMSFLADYLDAALEDMDATSVGVNHYTWLKHITCRGKPVEHRLRMKDYLEYEAKKKGPIVTNTTDDAINAMTGAGALEHYLSFELFERFGVFPVGSAPHIAENLPYYMNDPQTIARHHIRRKGYGLDGYKAFQKAGNPPALQKVLDVLENKTPLEENFPLRRSREGFAGIVASLHSNRPSRCIVAMPNAGQVSNLPPAVVVETWGMISGSGVFPVVSGPIPAPLTGWMQTIVDEEELAVEAALTGDRRKVVQALTVSPEVHDKDCVEALADKLIAAQKQYLPQFS